MTSDYELLGVAPTATADEIKRAFRQAIGKYHPDKVQHLGPEFLEIAVARTTEITRAYRALTEASARPDVDRHVGLTMVEPVQGQSAFAPEHAHVDALVRHAALVRLREAIRRELGPSDESSPSGFDLAVTSGKGDLWRRRERACVLVRLVAVLDAAAVRQGWSAARRHEIDGPLRVCVFVLGPAVSPPEELRTIVDELHRRTAKPSGVLTIAPVDIRTWSACVPTDAPPLVARLLQRLRAA